VLAETTVSGRVFHTEITRFVKLNLRMSNFIGNWCIQNLWL